MCLNIKILLLAVEAVEAGEAGEAGGNDRDRETEFTGPMDFYLNYRQHTMHEIIKH